MASPRVTFRCHDHLIAAIQRAAKRQGVEFADWIRATLAAAAGVDHAPMPEGFASIDPETAAEIRAKGGRTKAENARAAKNPNKSGRRKSKAA